MKGWINQVSAIRFTKSNQKFTLKHEFLKINVLPDFNVLSQLQPEAGQTWNCKKKLKKVWVDILCAPETKYNIEPDYTYEKILKRDDNNNNNNNIINNNNNKNSKLYISQSKIPSKISFHLSLIKN